MRHSRRPNHFRRLLAAGLCLAALSLAACSSYDIRHDWEIGADFASYHTYDWIPQTPDSTLTGADAARQANTLLDRRVRTAVDREMRAKGFVRNDEHPDLLVVYHTGTKDKVDATDWGYSYSGSYWGWVGRDIDVYSYTEGTLLVDLVDARTRALVWRGSATGVVRPQRSPEERTRIINEVVQKMFREYPPKEK